MEVCDESIVAAVQFGDYRTIRDVVGSRSVTANAIDANGCSLLHWAAINNRSAIATYLIEHGADVNYAGGLLLETPLQWAVRKSYYRMVNLLLRHGADINHKSNHGFTALHLAVAVQDTNLIYLLLTSSADVHATNNASETPLVQCLKSGGSNTVDIVRLLLKFDVASSNTLTTTTTPDEHGDTPLHIVCRTSHMAKSYATIAYPVFTAALSVEGLGVFYAKNHNNENLLKVAMTAKDVYMLRFLYDMYLGYYLSAQITTTISAILSVYLFFALIAWYGVAYGVLMFLLFYVCILEKFQFVTMVWADSKRAQGGAIGVVLTIVASYNRYISSEVQLFTQLVFLLLVGGVVVTMYLATVAKCSTVTSGDTAVLVQDIIHSSPSEGASTTTTDVVLAKPPVKLCCTCLVDKSNVAIHCSVCNACMSTGFDHHCAYLNNCIGHGNRRVFLLFLAVTASAVLFYVALTIYVTRHVYCEKEKHQPSMLAAFGRVQYCMFSAAPGFASISWMAVLLLLWLIALLCTQLAMIAAETTSYEAMRNRNENISKYSFSTMCRNVMQFLRTGDYHITRKQAEEDKETELEGLLNESRIESKSSLTRFRQGSFDTEQYVEEDGRRK